MRMAAGILIFSTALLAQGFINTRPITGSFGVGSFGNVVFPGGTSANVPGTVRTFGNVVFPGSGGPSPIVPSRGAPVAGQNLLARSFGVGGSFAGSGSFAGVGSFGVGRSFAGGGRRSSGTVIVPYAYPVYIGGYGSYVGGSYYADPSAMAPYGPTPYDAAPGQPPGNTTIVYPPVYPPQQPSVVMNQGGPDQSQTTVTTQGSSPAGDVSHYLIAFKDHTIYSAVAYWVEGDTLHYFTTGSTHNQVSLSLVDIDLTERLNREAGEDIRLR